jgi:cell fate regulator YaaT (PSP1 superfamily)
MEISAIKIRNSYQVNFVDTNHLFVNQNTLCVVETENGIDIGRVIKCRRYTPDINSEVKGKLLRMMNNDDFARLPEIESIEKIAFEKCREKAKSKQLEMKLIQVKCLFDKTKIIFYFVADNRIDFRELVRELASIFRTRIEMRQIGVRDEARLVGGFGPCGKELCCTHQRCDFDPVSIKMAKEQNLNLNSLKISGMCGRLLCCLSYEYELYKELNENMPSVGTNIRAGDKNWTVIVADPLRQSIKIENENRIIEIYKTDIKKNSDGYFISQSVIDKIISANEESPDEIYH